MAVVAAVLIVFVLFMALRFTQEQRVAAPSPSTPQAAPTQTTAVAAPPPVAPAPVAPVASVASGAPQPANTAAAPPAPPMETPSPGTDPSGTRASSGHHRHGDRGPTDNGTGDLGEFKAKF
jgi:hypothetical protein